MMIESTQLFQHVEQFFSYDGPHTPEMVRDAAESVALLVRYLNNATGPGNGKTTLIYAPQIYDLLGPIGEAQRRFDQLYRQLAEALQRHADDPTLADDRDDQVAAITVQQAASDLDNARAALMELLAAVDSAQQAVSHLAHRS